MAGKKTKGGRGAGNHPPKNKLPAIMYIRNVIPAEEFLKAGASNYCKNGKVR